MKIYLDALDYIMKNGNDQIDRTGVGTRSVFCYQMRFNLKEGFPAVTTKKLAWKAVVSELLWFIEGSNDERRLAEILHNTRDLDKKTIWTANLEADYWKDKAKFYGDLGRVYGVQWRNYNNKVDQLASVIKNIKEKPHDRRHVVTAWNPSELDQMALPPCHMIYQFYVSNKGLSCHMYQRSCDMFIGVPFNIASYSLLTHMVAQVCNLDVHEFVITLGDAHIYYNHFDQVKEQLTREPMELPSLWLNKEVTDIDNFTMDDIKLINYNSHSSIKADMAV